MEVGDENTWFTECLPTSYTVILKRTSGSDPKRNQREPFRHYGGWCKIQSFPAARTGVVETHRRQEARILADYRIKGYERLGRI